MALRAGRVGVSPEIVDNNGFIKNMGGGSEPVDAYTKAETDTLLATKADLSSLRANAKTFQFAYSGGKYGYKAGTNGTFHPFEEAGVTVMGWVKPAELSSEGITFGEGLEYVSGGYAILDQKMVYVDLIYRRTATGSAAVGGLPLAAHRHSGIAYIMQDLPEDIFEFFHGDATDFTMTAVNDGGTAVKYTDNNTALYYRRLIAQYPWYYEPARKMTEEDLIKEPPEEEPSEEIKNNN